MVLYYIHEEKKDQNQNAQDPQLACSQRTLSPGRGYEGPQKSCEQESLPRKGESMNNHGDYAEIGDLIEIISAQGGTTGIHRLVLGVTIKRSFSPNPCANESTTRYLDLDGESYKIRAAYARIISRARRK